jgi:hypothetical protein
MYTNYIGDTPINLKKKKFTLALLLMFFLKKSYTNNNTMLKTTFVAFQVVINFNPKYLENHLGILLNNS